MCGLRFFCIQMLDLSPFKWKAYSLPELGWVTLHVHFSTLFSFTLIGLTCQATSDFRLMKAVAEETRLSPLGRQQRLARLADDIQRYWAALWGQRVSFLRPSLWNWMVYKTFHSLMNMSLSY